MPSKKKAPSKAASANLTTEEKARRNACKDQAARIRAYLPTLRSQEMELEGRLRAIRILIADELRAYDMLLWEATATPEQIEARDEERAAAAA